MPWKDVRPMDEKLLFIADYLRQVGGISQLCARYGISRKTGYKWIARYQEEGLEGLGERSRRPHHPSDPIPYAIRQAILDIRGQRGTPGAKKIQALLARRFDEAVVPCKTSIYNILKAAGQVTAQRRKRHTMPSRTPLHTAHHPNELWSADYKGQFRMHDGRWCYPLTIMDHSSRYLLACEGQAGARGRDAKACFERIFREYGLPQRIRTDNGVPFASTSVGGLSYLSIWWIKLGILPERIKPGCPQQNGRHERMHRTLKQALGTLPAANLQAQQPVLDAFRHHYNHERPHESLDQKPPQAAYAPSLRVYPERLPKPEYPAYLQVNRVCRNGLVYWHGLRIYISYMLAGEWVGFEETNMGQWDVYFGCVLLGSFNVADTKGLQQDYLTLSM